MTRTSIGIAHAWLACSLGGCTDRVITDLVSGGTIFAEDGDGISSDAPWSDESVGDGDDASPQSTTRLNDDDGDDDDVDDGDDDFGTTTAPMPSTTFGPRLDIGAVCPGDEDCDDVPDAYDPFPTDPDLPGSAGLGLYAVAEGDVLLSIGNDLAPIQLGRLTLAGVPTLSLFDIAIDPFGVLYAVGIDGLYVCHPQTFECFRRMEGGPYNGAGFVTNAAFWADEDVLVLSGPNDEVHWISDRAGRASARPLGITYPWISRGDIDGFDGALLMTSPGVGSSTDALVLLTPGVGPDGGPFYGPLGEVSGFNYLSGLEGLAVTDTSIVLFDTSGVIVSVDQSSLGGIRFVSTAFSYLGAAWSSFVGIPD